LTRELRGRVGGRESQENEKERNAKDLKHDSNKQLSLKRQVMF